MIKRYRILTAVFEGLYTEFIPASASRICMQRFVTDRPINALHPVTEFYRQEFARHHRCLQLQRAYFSEGAITDVEAALTRIKTDL